MTSRRSSKKSKSGSTTGKSSNTQEQPDNQQELFPIVAMGASAGGLEAFIQLLSHLPIDTGMAFVLIQHLSPHQKSLLSEILSRKTQMPVYEVQDGMVVEPNNVYVIPPNAKMTISEGVLKLSPRQKTRGYFMAVDAFFISLAEDRGSKAIAVVLSGGDADGARGLEVIKGAGGITFAQCEDTAQVSSMPSSAIASGYVDFILTPEAIAEELTKISRHPYVVNSIPIKSSEVLPTENTDALSIIFSLLRISTGVDFTYYKQTTLKRRILRRMVLHKLENLDDYVKYLQDRPQEVNALYQDVLITVTYFFRDTEAFEALKNQIFPIITKDRTPESPLRIWVAGCSTGEEAYSIAICLLEYLTTQAINLPVQIFATDVNELAIDKARNGVYKLSQLADISPERLQRFFVPVENGYQISKVVRELCVFARQNLIGDPPFSRLDLITCRNVLIYLGSSAQKKLLPIFHYGLKPNGYLMLGTSETVGEFTDLFALVDRKYKIYSRKMASARLSIDLISNPYPIEIAHPQPTLNEDGLNDLEIQKEADRIVLNRYSPVGIIINSDLEILQFRGQTSSYLEPAPGRPSFNLLKMAKADLRLELRTAIHQAKKQQQSITKEGLQLREDERVRQIKFDVIPFKSPVSTETYFLVLFEDISSLPPAAPEVTGNNTLKSRRSKVNEQETNQLKQELATTREYLQSIIEEQQATNQDLRAANEEILSSNEELQSTNEELETAKEEIQATNEELNTINDELQRRNIESTQVSNDLLNLLSSINIPILMLGGDLRIRRFTPSAQTIFNLISTDIGRPLSDINHNLNLPNLEEQILEVISTLNLKAQEVQDQEGHWYDLRIRPYRTIDNKIDGAVVVLVDIDALKRSVNQLKASGDYAEAIVETVRESLVVLNAELRVVSANLSFYETFQVLPAETENRFIFEIGNGHWNIPQLRSLLQEILTNNYQIQGFEVEHNFELIGQKTMRLNGRKMPKIDDVQLILLAIEDITQFKEWEAERTHLLTQEQLARTAAETANRTKDEFLSMLSHELRNPLNALLGWAQLLRTHKLDEDTTNQAFEAIEHSAKVQAQLIEDLLDISRITSGRLSLNLELIELAIVVESALNLVRLSAESKNIQIQSRLEPSPRRILGDAVRLQQVIWNLLSNAIKFTPTGGRIELVVEYIDEQALIQVSDTGKGISADFLPFVFDRFRQADSSKTRSNSGLGLGLSIVRHVVELHGGTVEAHSPGEGQGTTFIVKLPLQNNPEESSTSNTGELVTSTQQLAALDDEIPSLDGLRVLLVDDELYIRELFTTLLEVYGVEVTAVTSAREALTRLIENPGGYDLLLSDISMPEEDGYTLIRQVRTLSVESGGQIPAIAMTAHARDDERREALSAGFQVHLAKPVEPTQLLLIVASLTGRIRKS
ncbi:ATPase [Nostoc linckia z18]|uniref:Circadian input-output histidine kinase CikA n=2 Tax=Nostoc linckia TaxID=92942 RepID=A0A9Q6EJC1_NOSLI|nr:chemotaxis protein CheB [Nostoc linckia]PHK33750.1 ATPase [Nostoc linckia z15]PHK44129.1 ATPase [Nostoc linckia z16]PHJ56925.1 ATPase [Nostoc linckia z1]PHJ59093.1 ATPase [Nostoc linckia z3]PHJ62883.1 ATPase [Nostoc linckia z2]